jgi:hypothetical protein
MKALTAFVKVVKSDAERSSKYVSHIIKLSHSIQTLLPAETPNSFPINTPML